MSDDHLTSEVECPDCSGFDRCDFHEGVRRGRQQIRDGESVKMEDRDNCEQSRELRPYIWLQVCDTCHSETQAPYHRYDDPEPFPCWDKHCDGTVRWEVLYRGEDTAEDELKDWVQARGRPGNGVEVSEESLKIAARAEWFGDGPADWDMKMTSWGANYPGSRDNPAQYARLRDVVEWIRGRREIMADNGRQHAQYAMLTLANELEEFTQQSEGGSGE